MRVLNASDAMREIAKRRISLTPALGLWTAEIWQNGDQAHNRKRAVRSVSAVSSTPISAVADLVEKLDASPVVVKVTTKTLAAEEIQW